MNFELRQGSNQSNPRSVQVVHDWVSANSQRRRHLKGEEYIRNFQMTS